MSFAFAGMEPSISPIIQHLQGHFAFQISRISDPIGVFRLSNHVVVSLTWAWQFVNLCPTTAC